MTNNDNTPNVTSVVTVTNNYNMPGEIFGAWVTKWARLKEIILNLKRAENQGELSAERLSAIGGFMDTLDPNAHMLIAPLLQNHLAIQENKSGCVPLDPLERTGTRPTSTEIPMIPKECPLLGALFYDSDGSSGTHS
jgi:hypothetical protein